jgi:sarcosine oxidase subunit beta
LGYAFPVSERAETLIVGGGVIGASIAWALARRGVSGIVVVDLDLAGVYASSELNAGGVRATWWQPVNIESCRTTLDFFRDHASDFGFRDRGYLWLYSDEELYARAREKSLIQNARGLGVEFLSSGEIAERFPALDRALEEIVGATFLPAIRFPMRHPGSISAMADTIFSRPRSGRGSHTDRAASSAADTCEAGRVSTP